MGVLLVTLVCAGTLHAVTPDEMEQARTIAAKAYLRWANDGSGYLDELNPKTMAELEKSLKAKEKENITAFKAVKTPSDYASWDKEALVKYWSVTFFAQPGLSDKGKAAKGVVKRKVSAMNVSAPSAKPAEQEKPAEEAKAAKPEENAAPGPEDAASAAGQPAPAESPEVMADEMAGVIEAEAAVDSAAAVTEKADRKRDNGSQVWIYILALCVLVGIVIWLVIFASKTMKNAEEFSEVKESQKEERKEKGIFAKKERVKVSDDDADEIEDERDADKRNDELSRREEQVLRRELLGVREENVRLQGENERLKAELSAVRRELEEAGRRVGELTAERDALSSAKAVNTAAAVLENASEEEMPVRRKEAPSAAAREIYLGRVNSKGLFVRADRRFTPGKSVYRLLTTDGFTGTYRPVTDGEMVDMMLDNPAEYLSGGCVAKDLEDTDGMTEIVTESAGTAIFEDGCWRVLRKAKIAYRS